jgi:hypothetical protein
VPPVQLWVVLGFLRSIHIKHSKHANFTLESSVYISYYLNVTFFLVLFPRAHPHSCSFSFSARLFCRSSSVHRPQPPLLLLLSNFVLHQHHRILLPFLTCSSSSSRTRAALNAAPTISLPSAGHFQCPLGSLGYGMQPFKK